MPVYNLDPKTAHLVPKVSREGLHDIQLIDSMVWEHADKPWGVDPGNVFTNHKLEKIRIIQVLYPVGAFSARVSEVMQGGPSNPLVWRTVGVKGARVKIIAQALKNDKPGKPLYFTPAEFEAWLGGKEPENIESWKDIHPPEVEHTGYHSQMLALAKRRKQQIEEREKMEKEKTHGGTTGRQGKT